jgi:hypothetical protein
MFVEQWWNDTAKVKMKYWEENIFECGGKGMDVNGALLVCY